MAKVKEPNVAGAFYPSNRDELLTMVEVYLNETRQQLNLKHPPKAIIAPHAGYIFSGPIAASAYRELIPVKDQIKRVAILSPTHYCQLQGIALSAASSFRTPLGELFVDHSLDEIFIENEWASYSDTPFEKEHALEVQLPFIQASIGNVEIIPMIVGAIEDSQMEQVIDLLIEDNVFVILSTDLSHFQSYAECKKHDLLTKACVEECSVSKLGHDDACGFYPLRGLIKWCHDHDAEVQNLDIRNSGDTAGDKGRVVGYGAWIVAG